MDFLFKNLGPIKEANVSLRKLNIICGKNNTGKTYLTYALYSLLEKFHTNFDIKRLLPPQKHIGENLIPLANISTGEIYQKILKKLSKDFSEDIHTHFATSEDFFKNFSLAIEEKNISPKSSMKKISIRVMGENEFELEGYIDGEKNLVFKTDKNLKDIDFSIYRSVLPSVLSDHIKESISHCFPKPFAITAERTGIQLFYKELDFSKNRVVDYIANKSSDKDDPKSLLKFLFDKTSRYPDAISDNINYVRDFENGLKRKSYIRDRILKKTSWGKLLGGNFDVSDNIPVFIDERQPNIKVPIYLCSSTIKSLFAFELVFLHHLSENMIVFIDEPELGLHPEKQKDMARFLVELSMMDDLILFITTHSDYIIREMNSLILLNKHKNRKKIMNEFNIFETLNHEHVNVCKIDGDKLMQVEVSPKGIKLDSFDGVILAQDSLNDKIIYG